MRILKADGRADDGKVERGSKGLEDRQAVVEEVGMEDLGERVERDGLEVDTEDMIGLEDVSTGAGDAGMMGRGASGVEQQQQQKGKKTRPKNAIDDLFSGLS